MLAFAAPLVPGKEADFKTFVDDLHGSGAGDIAALNERHGLSMHRAWLQTNPDGSHLVIVVLDGDDAEGFFAAIAKSEDPDDQWFREAISNVHGFDLTQPPPAPNERVV
jgi:hypothetical protein